MKKVFIRSEKTADLSRRQLPVLANGGLNPPGRIILIRNGALMGLFFIVLTVLGSAASLTSNGEQKPASVYIGVYVNQIYDVSLKENRFNVDFWLWFRWLEDNINPLESFEVVNGRIETKEGVYEDTVQGFNYAACRVNATITKFWDISEFPLDNHVLTIEIEDNENEDFKLTYIPDQENCGVNPGVQVPGWKFQKAWSEVTVHGYATNYGDISLPTNNKSCYSRFIYSLKVIRPGPGYFFKLFFGVFIAALIAFLVFFIKPTDLDPRFGLGVGAIFAAVASEYVIASSLPETNILTLADKLHIVAFAFIFLSIAQSILSLRLFTNGREKASRLLDRLSFPVFLFLYLMLSLLLILFR